MYCGTSTIGTSKSMVSVYAKIHRSSHSTSVNMFSESRFDSSLLWISHILYNLVYFVLLTVFLYRKTLLIYFPHPFEIPIVALFIVPSLFPPYTPLFLGYLTIAIIFLISFIFRAIAFSYWPYP